MEGQESGEKQELEADKDAHQNQRPGSGRIVPAGKETSHPPDLHPDRPNCSQDGQSGPVLAPGHHQKSYIKQCDVAKEA